MIIPPSTTTLLPCPFCGDEPDVWEPYENEHGKWEVTCNSERHHLLSVVTIDTSFEVAASMWNYRSPVARSPNEQLREQASERRHLVSIPADPIAAAMTMACRDLDTIGADPSPESIFIDGEPLVPR